jgi:hypothetical protein
MLSFDAGAFRQCDGLTRRNFLQIGALGGLGIALPMFLASRAKAETSGSGKDVSCILVWTQGGTSHHDTFDPKPQAPLSVRGEFGVIDTAVPGVQFTEILPNMAKNLGRFALLRGWNPRNGSHGTADQYVMSGRKFNPAVTYPTYGSVVSYHHGFRSVLPPFMQLGSAIDRRFGGGTSGILGLEYSPFEMLADPNAPRFSVRDISLPQGVSAGRLDRRSRMLAKVDALQRRADLQQEDYAALDDYYKAALNMITSPETKRAFAIEKEDPRLRDRYGRHTFGQSMLLARRLIESGVRFVTVTDGGWDTHTNNFRSLKDSRIPRLDQAIPALLEDLANRGMLGNTLFCWFTDFGRTPNINSASGRDHWSTAGFAIMAGAGIPGGSVLGATDDEGGVVTKDEYLSEDLGTTVYEKLGIPTDLIAHAPDGRPIRLIEGRPIKEWM